MQKYVVFNYRCYLKKQKRKKWVACILCNVYLARSDLVKESDLVTITSVSFARG